MLQTETEIRRYSRVAHIAMALFAGVAIVWGGLVPLEGAVAALGTVAVDGNVKKVQHQAGGVVADLLVREGSRVRAGDVVARLDDTQTRTNLGIVRADLAAQRVRLTRLATERDDGRDLVFPPETVAAAATDTVTHIAMDSETRLFISRRMAREGQKSQLSERIVQSQKDIEGLEKQVRATSEQLGIATEERKALEPLRLQGLVQKPRLTALEREISRSEGIIGDGNARLESARGKIREFGVQIAQVDRDRLAEVAKEIREAEAKIAELTERRIAAEDNLRRVDIRAPASGVVHELAVHTVGGVINQGEALMLIVPEPQVLVIEAKVAPQDIDQIHVDQPARIRFTSFNQRLTPELAGLVLRISPNTSKDQQTGATFYTVAVRLAEGQSEKLGGAILSPGMLAETFITTASRTALSFLLKPLTDNLGKVFSGR